MDAGEVLVGSAGRVQANHSECISVIIVNRQLSARFPSELPGLACLTLANAIKMRDADYYCTKCFGRSKEYQYALASVLVVSL